MTPAKYTIYFLLITGLAQEGCTFWIDLINATCLLDGHKREPTKSSILKISINLCVLIVLVPKQKSTPLNKAGAIPKYRLTDSKLRNGLQSLHCGPTLTQSILLFRNFDQQYLQCFIIFLLIVISSCAKDRNSSPTFFSPKL